MTNEELGRILLEVREEAKKTNGRLRNIELWRARVQGVWLAVSVLGPVVSALVVHYVAR